MIATMIQIHERIKQERLSAHLTEDEMASRLKINRSTYQYWEKKDPKIDNIKKVAKALGKPDDYFFIKHDEKDETHEPPVSKELKELIESNKTLAESNKTQAEANKIQAEANNKLAHAHAELISMLKAKEGEISSDVQRFALSQAEILALLKAAIEVDLDYKAKGDHNKANELAAKIGRATALNLGLSPKKGNFAGKKHS